MITVEELRAWLEAACRAAVGRGFSVVPCDTARKTLADCCCPFGACHRSLPYPLSAFDGIEPEIFHRFFHRFEGGDARSWPGPFGDLGAEFRARALRGEWSHCEVKGKTCQNG